MAKRRSKKYKRPIINDKSLKEMHSYLKKLKNERTIFVPNPNAYVTTFENKLKLELVKRGALEIIENPSNTNFVIVKVNKEWKP